MTLNANVGQVERRIAPKIEISISQHEDRSGSQRLSEDDRYDPGRGWQPCQLRQLRQIVHAEVPHGACGASLAFNANVATVQARVAEK